MKALNDKWALIWEHTNFERRHPKAQAQIVSSSDGYVLVDQFDYSNFSEVSRLYSLAEVQSEQWSIFHTYQELNEFMKINFRQKE